MTVNELTYLLQKPSSITLEQTNQLETILEEFPYFQAARTIRLKGLKDNNSFLYNNELKKSAAHTIDRSMLFDFITSAEFSQNEISNQIKKHGHYLNNITVFEAEEVIGKREINFDDAVKMGVKDAEQVFDPNLFELPKTENKTTVSKETITEKEKAEKKLGLGDPIPFDQNEEHSFAEWLRLAQTKPIKRTEDEKKQIPNAGKTRKFELIDDFISKSPRITPSKSTSKINLAKEGIAPPEALMTETLARVYLEQKNYKKAIQAYKILILKNPEKSGFFADQIRAIKKLQDIN
ncbi:MAG TPA: hypothetical protein VFM70_03640 [Salinimicrobium sp.]|nr:hypothetical protein [Salinimicrobium sp.]